MIGVKPLAKRDIPCLVCDKKVKAVYIPNKGYECPTCKNHVTITPHGKNAGTIASTEVRGYRSEIHRKMESITKDKEETQIIYDYLSYKLGYEYHTGNLKDKSQHDKVMMFLEVYANDPKTRDLAKEIARSKIYCVECKKDVFAELVDGKVIEPKKPQYHNRKYYRCKKCKNHVSVKPSGEPAGSIAPKEIRLLRMDLNKKLEKYRENYEEYQAVLDYLSKKLGFKFHPGLLRSKKDYDRIIELLKNYKK